MCAKRVQRSVEQLGPRWERAFFFFFFFFFFSLFMRDIKILVKSRIFCCLGWDYKFSYINSWTFYSYFSCTVSLPVLGIRRLT